MSDKMLDDLTAEKQIRDYFGIDLDIKQIITEKIPVGRMIEATVFLSSKKQLYVFIKAQSRTTLSDIKKLISRMGLKADIYFPPKGKPHYFDEIGKSKFHEVFPGRKHISDDDILFYKTLALYNPALVLISEIKDGVVYRYDSDSRTSWRPAAKFAYRRIRTS